MNKSRLLLMAGVVAVLIVAGWMYAQSGGTLAEGFRTVEVASVADAIEQLYGTQNYMPQDMRPLFKTKFAGPAHCLSVTATDFSNSSPIRCPSESLTLLNSSMSR